MFNRKNKKNYRLEFNFVLIHSKTLHWSCLDSVQAGFDRFHTGVQIHSRCEQWFGICLEHTGIGSFKESQIGLQTSIGRIGLTKLGSEIGHFRFGMHLYLVSFDSRLFQFLSKLFDQIQLSLTTCLGSVRCC